MADTSTSKISQERLNQIASRRLAALNIEHHPSGDHRPVQGTLQFPSGLTHPATRESIPRATFVVVGHDQVQFTDAPLSALPPVPFYEAKNLLELEERVATALAARVAALAKVSARFRQLQVETVLTPALFVRGTLKTTGHSFELLASPEGARVARILPVRGGKPIDIPPTVAPLLDLDEFPSKVDLELHLEDSVVELAQAAQRSAAAPPPAAKERSTLTVVPPASPALTLAFLASHFGPDAMLVPGARLEITQSFVLDGAPFTFTAVHEGQDSFRGRLVGPKGEKWSDKFDVKRFPGIAAVVGSALDVAPGGSSAPTTAPVADKKDAPVQSWEMPQPNEIWAMNVLVQTLTGDEVRYSCMNNEGQPYGAPRVLSQADFENVFCQGTHGDWRLLIRIDAVQGDGVVYRQLDRQRQARGTPKRTTLAILTSTFLPEAATY